MQTSLQVSGHNDIDDEEESDDKEQPADCISKPAFKGVMNAIHVLEHYSLFSNFGADLMKALNVLKLCFWFVLLIL